MELPVDTTIPEKKKVTPLLWVLAGVVGLMITIVVALLIIAVNMIISSAKINPNTQTQAPKVEPTVVSPKIPSKYASDSAILQLDSSLKNLRQDIDSTDLFEPQLSPPSLDLNLHVTIQP